MLYATPSPAALYTYQAAVESVVDGDSLHLTVDLGFHLALRGQLFRLAGCNARELAQPGGPEAKANLVGLLPAGTTVTIRSVRPDKYADRCDAAVALPDGTDLVGRLVADGWVAVWDGRGARPVPPWPRTVS